MPLALACIPMAPRSKSNGFRVLIRGSVMAREGMTENWVCGALRETRPIDWSGFKFGKIFLRRTPLRLGVPGEEEDTFFLAGS